MANFGSNRPGSQKTLLMVFGGIVLLGFMIIGWLISQYNTMVVLDVNVEEGWSNVETEYQRRVDLVPQLIGTVEGAADFEQSTIIAVTEARTNWLNASQDPGASLDDQMSAAGNFDSALARLLVTMEAYPNLTATQGFITLQDQLEGTENRIAYAREEYNNVSAEFNRQSRQIPMIFFRSAFGFEDAPMFKSESGAEKAPEVNFDFGS